MRKPNLRREARRDRAEERCAARATRSPEEQFALLADRPGTAAREQARLILGGSSA